MEALSLDKYERELKKRLAFPYTWGRKQKNSWDNKTNFIYSTFSFEEFLEKSSAFDEQLKNYSLNRWFNFYSAKAIESIFTAHPNVIPHPDPRDKYVDFYINSIPFDLKTTTFPKAFRKPINYAKKNKEELIYWLYTNQSRGKRWHLKNRLFIVLFDEVSRQPWKMKSELLFMKSSIDNYILHFDINKLCKLEFDNERTLSDIIWITNRTKIY